MAIHFRLNLDHCYVIEKPKCLTAQLVQQIISIFPDDSYFLKRKVNLSKSNYVLIAKKNDVVIGVIFIRNIFFIPNATWVVGKLYQRQGIGLSLLKYAQNDYRLLTAVTHNEASKKLACKTGFFFFPLNIGVWYRK